jgi:hypothetical protein
MPSRVIETIIVGNGRVTRSFREEDSPPPHKGVELDWTEYSQYRKLPKWSTAVIWDFLD